MYYNRILKAHFSCEIISSDNNDQIISRYRLQLVRTVDYIEQCLMQSSQDFLMHKLRTLSGIISINCQHFQTINKCRR